MLECLLYINFWIFETFEMLECLLYICVLKWVDTCQHLLDINAEPVISTLPTDMYNTDAIQIIYCRQSQKHYESTESTLTIYRVWHHVSHLYS